jgi:hypothetical protein
MLIQSLLLIVLILSSALPCNAGEINIPLSIHEALREGVTGIDRVQEPVTVGIPFPKGMLYEKNGMPQLALEGTKEYQFRTLARWPDGSVRWALVDFQTDVKAGSMNKNIRVISGSGSSPGKLAIDKGQFIQVDTGAMIAEIKKKGFSLLDSVTVNGREILSRDSKGISVLDENGREYLASNDKEVRVTIEENGPVRAVIKAEGTHIGDDKRMMDYTVRLHFYKNRSKVKVFYTLRNASRKQFEHAFIRSLDLVTKLSLHGPYQISTAKHNGVLKEQLSEKDDNVVYYQAVSDFPQEYRGDIFYEKAPIPPDYKREKQRGFVQEGYWIKKNGQILASGKRSEYPDLAFIDMSDKEGNGLTVGVRFAAGWWPKSLRARGDGTLEVGLWPGENQVGYWIRYGSHNTFEIMYEFHDKQNDPAASMKKFQYPLVAKASVEWYNGCVNGIYPLYNFVSFEDEMKFIESNGWEYGNKAKNRREKMRIWRYHYWGWGGYWNQHDFARVTIVNFLRDTQNLMRAGEYFLYSEARFNYNADWSIYHSDDYECTSCTKRGYDPEKKRDKAGLMGVTFDFEHPHWYGLSLYYYLTGDERIKEAIYDFGEIIKEWYDKPWITAYPRYFGWEMYNLAAIYDFTGDSSFIKLADDLFLRLLNERLNPQNPIRIYIDWDRGYIAGGSGSGWGKQAGLKPGLMTGYVIYDGLLNYYLLIANHPLKEKVADVLEGISEFMYREPYFEGQVRNKFIIWLPYVYNLEDRSRSEHEYKTLRQAFYVNLMPYLLNGEERWLERMDKIIRTASIDAPDHLDHPGLQSMLYHRLHPKKDNSPPLPITDLLAEPKGGDVILSWTVPADEIRYQIKYSHKKLVESLEFDPDKRTYKYDPNEYANWWAGENVPDEPNPGAQGTKQQYVLKNLKPGHYYFAIRSWDKSNNRSNISNLASVEIK